MRYPRGLVSALSAATLALPAAAAPGASPAPRSTDEAQIVHVLNRLGYGPRPGDVDKVARLGLQRWIEQQLHPERIEDRALQARLAGLKTAGLETSELLARYDIPREVRRDIQRRRAELGEDPSPEQQRELRRELMEKYRGRLEGTPRQVVEELAAAKLMRAIDSERQLDEVLVDFWLNHFNVFAGKGPVKFMVAEYEREVIRRHAWGKFEDLLTATAKSPAMLFYLDNWLSATSQPSLPEARRAGTSGFGRFGGRRRGGFGMRGRPGGEMPAAQEQQRGRRRGLNENYAREIMELHTLGVDGGYTQKDVTEVARCFTGWTIRGLRQQRPEFTFQPRLHDQGDKVVLGTTIKSGGQDEGEQVIHLLATHPATARFISYKLARRFVADEPPAALVERAAATFRRTDGDIREVVRTIVTSAEFFDASARAAKVKTPFEFVVSAVRASGAAVTDTRALGRRLAAMGMPLYLQQPPTGYKDTAEAWVSTSGLLARLNLALDLAAGRVPGISIDTASLGATASDPAAALAAGLLPAGLSESTRKTLAAQAAGQDPVKLAGLILGSPEFQRR